MPYQILKSDRDLQSMLQRVAAEELDEALARLRAPTVTAGDVHDVRKRVKKLRGMLRLLRFGLPGFAQENAALRDAAAHLSAQRDTDVRLMTFDSLAGPEAFTSLSALRGLLAVDDGPVAADPVPAARDALALIRHRVDAWHVEGSDRHVLDEGLAQTRRHARRAMTHAAVHRTAHAMHEWRKRVKDGWYQARLLTPIQPEVLKPFAEEAGELGEDLGKHHDLAVLADHVVTLPDDAVAAATRAEVLARIAAAQGTLESRVFLAGDALLEEKPKSMARRWTGWWQDWRD